MIRMQRSTLQGPAKKAWSNEMQRFVVALFGIQRFADDLLQIQRFAVGLLEIQQLAIDLQLVHFVAGMREMVNEIERFADGLHQLL